MNVIRSILVKASESGWLREHAPRFRFVRLAAARFMPGEKADDALTAAQSLAASGIRALLTQLGENIAERVEAEAVTAHYLNLLGRIREADLPAEVSVKLTQLGLDLDREFCFANLVKLIERSAATSSANSPAAPKTLWIDMEQSAYVEATLDLYARARKEHENVGVCVQAYLHRTEQDLEALISMGASVRLVKGAYSEPAEIAFANKHDVDENYFRLAQRVLGGDARRAGVRAVMATHDRALIARLTDWAAAQSLVRNELEFAMLFGIQRAEQLRLAREGYRSGVLISYGSFWFPWFMRRLAERPANVWFLMRNLFSS
jgi:proline dehydrogenase